MIITVNELRGYIDTEDTDEMLTDKIEAIESFICKYTNNEFKNRETGLKSYPKDVKMGVVKMMKYDLSSQDRVGVSSETISRHSVTYTDAGNGEGGYPYSVIGFLVPYKKARF